MKTCFALLFLLLPWGLAQAQSAFAKADSLGEHFDEHFLDLPDLARKLSSPFCTEAEKARVLFAWIAHHIAFDVEKYENPPTVGRFVARTEREMQRLNQRHIEKEVQLTLKYRKGVCQNYSQLYKAMCRAAGLECLTVSGQARDFFKPSRSSHFSPHAWNVVKIDGQWALVDVTWGAGYVIGDRFVKQYSPGYFMTPPAWFAQGHLPNLVEWQLLKVPVMRRHFPHQPLLNIGQQDYPLLDFSPKLEMGADGLAQLRFKFERTPSAFFVANGHTDNQVPFSQSMADGWVVLHFPIAHLSQVTVYMGDRNGATLGWLGKYDVK
jgi:hypothetical protein